jgi:cytochrome P450
MQCLIIIIVLIACLQTVSTLQTFFLTMALHPDVQLSAQKQLDEVVGNDRLPEFSDLDSLPYIHAIVKELMRWKPVTPLGA